MTNPHYKCITTTYPKYFQPSLLRWNWIIVLAQCFRGRALNSIRPTEKDETHYYVDVA